MEGQAQEALLPAEGDEGGDIEESPEALAVAEHLDVPILLHHEQAVVARRGGHEDRLGEAGGHLDQGQVEVVEGDGAQCW